MADVEAYIVDPVEIDETTLEEEAYDFLTSVWPDWTPSGSGLVDWLISAVVRMISELTIVTTDVPHQIFEYFGESLLGVPIISETFAEAPSTWTVSSNPGGRTIESGTIVTISDANGNPFTFEVVDDVVIDSPSLTTAAGGVLLRAQDGGADANGMGPGAVASLVDSIQWIDSITLTAATSGGRAEEETSAYLDRLSGRLTLLTPRPILPRDYELLARDLADQYGAEIRALALDGYNPADGTFNNERMVAVALVNTDGTNVDAGVKSSVDADLENAREVNFVVNLLDPTRTPVDVTFQVQVLDGYDPDETTALAVANVEDYTQPAAWGRVPGGSDRSWMSTSDVRRQDISQVINNTDGVAYWTTLTIGLNGGAQTTNELTPLPGVAPLATPGVINGSHT